MIVCVVLSDREELSTTTRVAVYVPGAAYACVGATPKPVAVSPKSQE